MEEVKMIETAAVTPDRPVRKRKKVKPSHIITYTLLGIWTLFLFIPVYTLLVSSITPAEEASASTFTWFPQHPTLQPYADIFIHDPNLSKIGMPTLVYGFLNTMWITLLPVVVGLIVSGLSAYAYSKLNFPGRRVIFKIAFAISMIPLGAFSVISFLFYDMIGWTESALPLIVPGLFGSMNQAEQSGKAIAYIPAQDGKVYEMRRNEIGTFVAPSLHIAELEDIRAGFQMSLPRLPAALLTQIIAFFRRVCVDYGRDVEALVNVLWDREKGEYVLHVPPQRIDKASVETDLSAQPNPERYLHVMDVHSHNTMAACFSRTDDLDEQATRLYMVIGRLDRYYPDIRCRFACGGRHVEIPAEQVCERTDVPFAPEWLKAVQETGLKEAA